MARVPLLDEIPEPAASALAEVGGRPINLYRALASQPQVLRAWIDMAWTLRTRAATPRTLRELIALRGAQVFGSEYEWTHHRRMGLEAGITEAQVAELEEWRRSELFSPVERAALAFAEGMMDGEVTPAAADGLAALVDPAAFVELTVMAGFYAMVPRVLQALEVPLEDEAEGPAEGAAGAAGAAGAGRVS